MPDLAASTRVPQASTTIQDLVLGSGLSEAMDNTTQHDFVLQKAQPGSKYYLKCQIYFFDTPQSIKIEIGWNEIVRDVIKHIMTLYRKDKEMTASMPLSHPDNPDRYQLFFIDDDESEHAPDYDMGARNPDEPIGEFQTLAFVTSRNYKGD